MINFKKFINLHAEKKCHLGYKFDEKLGVCVPKGGKQILSLLWFRFKK